MKKFCIVIPIYKENLDPIDELSLKRLYKVIKNKYDIYLVRPKQLDGKCQNYYKILKRKNVYEVVFDDNYFKDTGGYSQLCILYDFYDKFSDYEYMYIYQLDCYLVKDELEYWCNQGYDYIGGPIISENAGWINVKNPKQWEPQVGNGGFSLRKISTFKEITNPEGEFRKEYNLTDEKLKDVNCEDLYYMNFVNKYYDIEKPNWIEALSFSLDMNVDVIYDRFKFDKLPMGIHGWPRNIRYWQNVLEEIKGNKEVIDICEKRYEKFFKGYYGENNSTARFWYG